MLTAAAFCLADLVLDFSSRIWSARSSADRRIAGGGSSHLKALDPPQPRRAKHTTEGKAHHEGHGTPQRARHTTSSADSLLVLLWRIVFSFFFGGLSLFFFG